MRDSAGVPPAFPDRERVVDVATSSMWQRKGTIQHFTLRNASSAPIPLRNSYRSGCPVSLGLDVFGDKWALLIVRDLTFNGKRHFGELLMSGERISTSILTNRLKILVDEGVLTKTDNPGHKQKRVYSLGAVFFPGRWRRT